MAKKSNPLKTEIPASVSSEKRAFRMHPKLLWDVITRQAGTLSKACLELTMNSIDAGSTRCDITITPTRVVVVDDGKGFVGREEVEKFFETFGQPHEEGDATYGRFRMGRGQAFAFGRCRFFSNQHLMDVDIKPQEKAVASDGLNYDLRVLDKPVKGCRVEIDLYDKLLPSQVDAIVREIAAYVKFAQIPVTVNGAAVATPPAERKWPKETDDAYFDLKDSSTLSVYNLGVLVRSYPASHYGCGGTIVSKRPVDVNFARNDIQSSCRVFKRIAAVVRKTGVTDSAKKKKLTEAEWEALANDVRTGQTPFGDVWRRPPMIRLVTGTMLPFCELISRIDKHSGRIAVGEPDEHMADRIMQRRVALVLDKATIERFGYGSLKEFCTGLAKLAKKAAAADRKSAATGIDAWSMENFAKRIVEADILDRKDFGKHVKADYDEVPLKELGPAEKFAFEVISAGCSAIGGDIYQMVQVVRQDHFYASERILKHFPLSACQRIEAMCGNEIQWRRDLKVGASSSAQAWTDGERQIWLNRRHLRLVSEGLRGMTQLAELLLHEYLHQSPNTGDLNVHDEEFYETHHDLAIDTPIVGRAVAQMMDRAVRLVRAEKRRPTGALKKFEDQFAELDVVTREPAHEIVPAPDFAQGEADMEEERLAAAPSMG